MIVLQIKHNQGCMFDESKINNNNSTKIINTSSIDAPSKDDGVADKKATDNTTKPQQNQINKPKINKNKKKNKNKNEEKSLEISENKQSDNYDSRDHLNVVLIGHVDHGKSTIAGQILIQTGQIDERTILKYKKSAKDKGRDSWWIAYLLDQDAEEQKRGKTIECGKAEFKTPNKRCTILDAPGHLNYVPNMIIGATQADVALLVISARKGEFEDGFDRGGQTREHGLIALTLGIQRVIVIINKMDTINYDETRYNFIKEKILKFLTKDNIVGFKKKYISFVPISGQKAINIGKSNIPQSGDWYKGKPLLTILDELKTVKRAIDKPLRLPIVDAFKSDRGHQIIGMIQQGVVKKGQMVKIMPYEITTKIHQIQIEDGKEDKNGGRNNDNCLDMVTAGENVIITFEKSDKLLLNKWDLVYGGCVICDVDDATEIVFEFIADIYVHEIPDNLILTKGYRSMLHCHNLCVECEIIGIKKTKKMNKPILREHDRAVIKIKLNEKCSLEAFDKCRVLGRFILRDRDKTVIIGKIKSVITGNSKLLKVGKKRNIKGSAGGNKQENDEQKSDKY